MYFTFKIPPFEHADVVCVNCIKYEKLELDYHTCDIPAGFKKNPDISTLIPIPDITA
jgi:hypothetical protein